MKKLTLTYLGKDDWNRKVFEDEKGHIYKDVNCSDDVSGMLLCTATDFEGEPAYPIKKDIEIEFIGLENLPTEEERFNYMMLDRLKTDCEYYLGYGNKNPKHLWAEDEVKHIAEMKRIWNWFSDDKKPEWLTMEQILEYEKALITNTVK